MRKRNLLVVAMAAPALLLSACGGGTSTPTDTGTAGSTPTEEATSEAPAEPTEDSTEAPQRDANVDLVIWTDADRAPTVTKFAEEFGAENGITTAVQVAVETRKQFREATEVDQGPDVVVGAHDWLGEFVQAGVVAPVNLSADVSGQFAENAVAAANFGGQNYGVPYATENLALIRNKALAPEAPATMEDLVAAGQAAVDAGTAENILIQPVGQTGNAYYTYPYLSACGGGIFEQDATGGYTENVIVNSPESLKGAEELAKLGKDGILSTSVGDDNAEGLFTSGKAAFMIGGPWAISNIKAANIDYEVSNLPSFEGCEAMKPFLGVQLFYVSSKAKNATLAQEFVTNYIPRKDVQLALFEALGRPPANLEALTEVSANDADVKAFAAAGEDAAPMPNIPAMNSVWGPLGQAAADVIGGDDPKTRFDAAQEEIVNNIKAG